MIVGTSDFLPPSSVDTHFAGPIFSGSQIGTRRVTDGLSTTLAIGERHIPPADPTRPANMQQYGQGDTAFFSGDLQSTIFRGTRYGLASGPNDNSNELVDAPITRRKNLAARILGSSCLRIWMGTWHRWRSASTSMCSKR